MRDESTVVFVAPARAGMVLISIKPKLVNNMTLQEWPELQKDLSSNQLIFMLDCSCKACL